MGLNIQNCLGRKFKLRILDVNTNKKKDYEIKKETQNFRCKYKQKKGL
jgi:hypothetical protein